MKLGQQDQAKRLSIAPGKPPFGIAVGKQKKKNSILKLPTKE
jgi:hypothetical protein